MRRVFIIIIIIIISLIVQNPVVTIDGSTINVNATLDTSPDSFTIFTSVPEDTEIEEGNGYSPVWSLNLTATFSNYTAYINDTVKEEKNQKSNDKIMINNILDGTEIPAVYNITIVIDYSYNNSDYTESDTVLATVVPAESPLIYDTPSQIIDIPEGLTEQFLRWTAFDLSPSNYTIYKNGDPLSDATSLEWNSNQTISYSDSNITVGETYNYTIIIEDSVQLTSTNSTNATIIENPVPQITDTTDLTTFAFSDPDKTFIWNFTDIDPQNYSIYKDSVLFESGVTPDNNSIVLDLVGIIYGEYNFTIVIQDSLNQQMSHSVTISIIDIVAPVWSSTPTNRTISFGQQLSPISWVANDDNHYTFTIYHDNEQVSSGFWESNNAIVFTPTINQILGLHEFKITIKDSYGNNATHIIYINVKELGTLTPEVSISTTVYVDSIDILSGSWNSTTTLIGTAVIVSELFDENNQLILSNNGSIDTNGQVQLNLSYSKLNTGEYTWKLKFIKYGYETQIVSKSVTLEKVSIKSRLIFPDQITQGEDATVELILTYTSTDSSQLQLNQLILPSGNVKNIETVLEINYQNNAGESKRVQYMSTTNDTGVAIFTIPGVDTVKFSQIIQISGSTVLNSYDITTQTVNIFPDQIRIDTGSPNELTNQTLLGYTILLILILIVLIGIGGLVGYFIIRNPLTKISPLEHISHLKSIQIIILSNSDGVPLFEHNFAKSQTDSTMVAALSSAISTFLDEFIDTKEKGLETIERNNLSLLSHRSETSVLTVVSNPKLPSKYHSQIVNAHDDLNRTIPSRKLSQNYYSSEDNLDSIILNSLHQNGIRVNLLFPLSFSSEEFREYINLDITNIPKPLMRKVEFLRTLNIQNVNLDEFFDIIKSQTDYNDEQIAELLFALDDIGLIT